MFGGCIKPPKQVQKSRSNVPYDINLPTLTPGLYAHRAREPETNTHVRWLEYHQHLDAEEAQFLASEAKRLQKEAATGKYDKHVERKVFQRLIQERFKEKVKAYEESIEKRREKLKKLLCDEEQEFILETIDQAQKGVFLQMQERKEKAQQFKAQREAERLKIVSEKRMQQYMEDSQELRPFLEKRNIVDTKVSQLEQIKEHEMRKEAEKELERMWYDLMMKERQAKIERENQEMLKKSQVMKETVETWNKQIYGRQLLKQEAERIAAEDRIEMVKLEEQLRREKIEALDAKRRKRDQIAKELKEQVAVQEKYLAERRKEEEALNNAFSQLAQEELEREKRKIQDFTKQAKRETAIYRQHLKELAEERKKEEEQLNALLEEHRKFIEKKQEEAYCKIKQAKEELRKNVLAGRAQQLEYKRQEAENQLKLKEAENELLRMAYETNERLQAEHDRLQAEAVRLYREDLTKQIEENQEKRRLEREQLERELAEGLAEEERRRQHVLEIINARLEDQSFKHPFRRVLEKPPCPCNNH